MSNRSEQIEANAAVIMAGLITTDTAWLSRPDELVREALSLAATLNSEREKSVTEGGE